ncbi:hypothetical protein EDD85DRAFT_798915 [Armillaria nabsnona]|nr:hypothetical protein EDD85DRAFT_798915 [Armillaria nabsnona]
MLKWQPLYQFGEVAKLYEVTAQSEMGWEGDKTLSTAMKRSEGETDHPTGFPDAENKGGDGVAMQSDRDIGLAHSRVVFPDVRLWGGRCISPPRDHAIALPHSKNPPATIVVAILLGVEVLVVDYPFCGASRREMAVDIRSPDEFYTVVVYRVLVWERLAQMWMCGVLGGQDGNGSVFVAVAMLTWVVRVDHVPLRVVEGKKRAPQLLNRYLVHRTAASGMHAHASSALFSHSKAQFI